MLSKIISNLSEGLESFPISIETAFRQLSSLENINVEIRDKSGTAALTFIDNKLIGVQFKPKHHVSI